MRACVNELPFDVALLPDACGAHHRQIPSFFGGTRQGMAISWPARIKDAGSTRWQFHHVIDILPTILEVTGIRAPDFVDGIAQKPIEGVSLAYTFDKANATCLL